MEVLHPVGGMQDLQMNHQLFPVLHRLYGNFVAIVDFV